MDKNEGGKQWKRNTIEKEKEGGKGERKETILIALLNKRQGDTWREHGNRVNPTHCMGCYGMLDPVTSGRVY